MSTEEERKNNRTIAWTVTYSIIHLIAFLFALYLSFKCHGGKFDFWSFIVAFFCPWIYIIYILASRGGFCGNATTIKLD